MASGTKSKGATGAKGKGARAARASVVSNKPKPWGTIIAVIAVLALAGGVFTYAFVQIHNKNKWVISDKNQDPSSQIAGVVKKDYPQGQHVTGEQRVAYDQSPPFGGPHDGIWADCTGVVYATAVRTENMVHALEHGTVWIAYNPDQIKGPALDKLKSKVDGQTYLMMSPYPGLDKPISLQSWGHQLKLDSADDGRIDDFIKSLRANRYTTPEPGGRCDPADPTQFDVNKPPAFVGTPPSGANVVSMDGKGSQDAKQAEINGEVPTSGTPAPSSGGAAPPSNSAPPPSK